MVICIPKPPKLFKHGFDKKNLCTDKLILYNAFDLVYPEVSAYTLFIRTSRLELPRIAKNAGRLELLRTLETLKFRENVSAEFFKKIIENYFDFLRIA